MDNTAETPTKAAGIFKLGQPAFLHTATGRCVTFAAGCAAMFTALATKDAGLAAACAALIPPAVVGGLIGKFSEARRLDDALFFVVFTYSAVLGGVTIQQKHTREQQDQQQAHIHSLPEMNPDMPVTTTAKEHFCGQQTTGWIEVKGQKLNCGN